VEDDIWGWWEHTEPPKMQNDWCSRRVAAIAAGQWSQADRHTPPTPPTARNDEVDWVPGSGSRWNLQWTTARLLTSLNLWEGATNLGNAEAGLSNRSERNCGKSTKTSLTNIKCFYWISTALWGFSQNWQGQSWIP
jgi:hypothetical protein